MVQPRGRAGIFERMSARSILQSFEAWRAAGTPLVLATVYETHGSTYSKAGHRILLAANMAEMETGDIRRTQDFHRSIHRIEK